MKCGLSCSASTKINFSELITLLHNTKAHTYSGSIESEIRELTNKLKDGLDIFVASVALDILRLLHILLLLLTETEHDLRKLRVRNYYQKPMFRARIHQCCASAESNPGNPGKLRKLQEKDFLASDQCSGSVTFRYGSGWGSGSGSCSFRKWPSRWQQNKFFSKFLSFFIFDSLKILHHSSKKKVIKKSQNIIKNFLHFFSCCWKDSDPYKKIENPDADPEGQKTYESYEFLTAPDTALRTTIQQGRWRSLWLIPFVLVTDSGSGTQGCFRIRIQTESGARRRFFLLNPDPTNTLKIKFENFLLWALLVVRLAWIPYGSETLE